MYKILIDSDSLIKITKIGLIELLCENTKICITKEIFKESVLEGKKRLYEDAKIIENLIKNNKIEIIKNNINKIINNFGIGENSILYALNKNIIPVSDDQKFLNYLESKNIEYLQSVTCIFLLFKKKIIKKNEYLKFLEKLKLFIKDEVYNNAKNMVNEK